MHSEVQLNEIVAAICAGDNAAAGKLWDRFALRIRGLARRVLARNRCRISNESDVAVSVLDSLIEGLRERRFRAFHDWDDLWSLVAAITRHKAVDHRRRATRERNRGGAHVGGESDLAPAADASDKGRAIDQHASPDCTPDEIAAAADEFLHLLSLLSNSEDRLIALLLYGTKIGIDAPGYQGEWTVKRVADLLDIPKRTLERRIQGIRSCWSAYLEML